MWSIVTVIDGKLNVLYMTDDCVVLKGGGHESSRRNNALPILDSNPLRVLNPAEDCGRSTCSTVPGNVQPKLCKEL